MAACAKKKASAGGTFYQICDTVPRWDGADVCMVGERCVALPLLLA
jgi:hypothetical protein